VFISPSDVADLDISDTEKENAEDEAENIRNGAVHSRRKHHVEDDDGDVDMVDVDDEEDQGADDPSLDPVIFNVQLRKIARAVVNKSLAAIGKDLSWEFENVLAVYGVQIDDKKDPYIMRKREEACISPNDIRFVPQPSMAEYQHALDLIKLQGVVVNFGDKERLIAVQVPNVQGTFKLRVLSGDFSIHEGMFERIRPELEGACEIVYDEWVKTKKRMTPYEMKKVKANLFYKTATLLMLALWPKNTFRFAAQQRKFRAPYHVQRLQAITGKVCLLMVLNFRQLALSLL
jgi:hypothetical protein